MMEERAATSQKGDKRRAWLQLRLLAGLVLVGSLLLSAGTTGGLVSLREAQRGPPAAGEQQLLNWPKEEEEEEVLLLPPANYSKFAQIYPGSSEAPDELLSSGRHNLATLSGVQSYFRRQRATGSPFEWAKFDGASSKFEEGFVSHPAAELKRANAMGRMLNRLLRSERDFEIPNWPLDEQPDGARITHIDADLRACTAAIKDQRGCGACYAFSWLSLVEWHYCSQRGEQKVVDFSEQHLVDCGQVARLSGCTEGKLSHAKDFSQVFGLHLEADYPYTSKQGACKKAQGTLALRVNDFRRILVDRDQFERTLAEQPILLEVHLPADIRSYSSGIHPGDNCDSRLGHGMLLVGHGRQEGRPYWLLRNSMGKRWGENGYLRLSRELADMRRCFRSAFVAKFRFKDLDEATYSNFYQNIKFQPQEDAPPAGAAHQEAHSGAGLLKELTSG